MPAALHLIRSPSPHDEGILWQAPAPGRSSGSWFILLPAPSQHDRESHRVNRISRENADASRFTNDASQPRQWPCGFRPHLQRRDREGISPSSLTQESQCRGTIGERDKTCQGHTSPCPGSSHAARPENLPAPLVSLRQAVVACARCLIRIDLVEGVVQWHSNVRSV
jgi:hypothetical protein